ncbi:MAG: hypothetical protein IKD69_16590 [Solobacterium sp.]|nr:hypothetical protein [Solobacterium sp.]
MRSIAKRIIGVILTLTMILSLSACAATLMPSVNFGFKIIDGAGAYDESITSFEVGKKFYTCITIKLVTNKKKPTDYRVVIDIPKTKEVEVKGMGGLEPDSIVWNESDELTRMTFTMQGYKEATDEKILFYGTPTDEGEAKMMAHIYDKDGNEMNSGYSRTIFFEYTLQD